MAATESKEEAAAAAAAAASSSSSSTFKRKIDDISNGNSEDDNVIPTTATTGAASTVAAASVPPDVTNGDFPIEAGAAAVSLEAANAEADLTAPTGGARPKIRRPEAIPGQTSMLENGTGLYHDQIAAQVSSIDGHA